MSTKTFPLLFYIFGLLCQTNGDIIKNKNDDFIQLGLTAAEVLLDRGYEAKVFKLTTSDGYVLELVRGRNPLFKNAHLFDEQREPILFVHGALCKSLVWLGPSSGVRPKDLTHHIERTTSEEDLITALKHEPSSKSLPFLAMNSGYEVWLMTRRGFPGSDDRAGHLNRTMEQVLAAVPESLLNFLFKNTTKTFEKIFSADQSRIGALGLKSLIKRGEKFMFQAFLDAVKTDRKSIVHNFDPEYWNYTLDQQASIDIPEVIRFVVEKTGHKKLTYVGHSTGSALALLALSESKHLEDLVSKFILWAPAINLGHAPDMIRQDSKLAPIILPFYRGPLLFSFMTKPIQRILSKLCSNKKIAQRTICRLIIETLLGKTDKFSLYKEYLPALFPEATGDLELAHLVQLPGTDLPRKYMFRTKDENLRAYGEEMAPIYNLSRITHTGIYLYAGNTDNLVSVKDVSITSSQLTVNHSIRAIGGSGIKFNHGAYYLHDLSPELVILPSMWNILR